MLSISSGWKTNLGLLSKSITFFKSGIELVITDYGNHFLEAISLQPPSRSPIGTLKKCKDIQALQQGVEIVA